MAVLPADISCCSMGLARSCWRTYLLQVKQARLPMTKVWRVATFLIAPTNVHSSCCSAPWLSAVLLGQYAWMQCGLCSKGLVQLHMTCLRVMTSAAVRATFCSKKRAEAVLSAASHAWIFSIASCPEASLIHCVSSSSKL